MAALQARPPRAADWLPEAPPELAVGDLTLDSRHARPGVAFLALAGSRGHGLAHAADAIARGAAAVLHDAAAQLPAPLEAAARQRGVALVPVARLEEQAGSLVSRFFGDPAATLPVVGVTGTDGKTSVTHFIAQCLQAEPRPGALLGTLGVGRPGRLRETGLTTPDLVSVHRHLAALRAEGAGSVAMEVSSHALHQGRVRGVRFAVAVLTNLSRDHLDYHGTPEDYAEAKARLFVTPGLGCAVLNLDDPFGRRLQASLAPGVGRIGYRLGPGAGATLHCADIQAEAGGLRLALRGPGRDAELRAGLLGRFNAANVLACLGALLGLGLDWEAALARAGRISAVPGRMESFGGAAQPTVVVDYAHTPAALAAALAAMREHFAGRLWCVFGCGGDRDPGKRPEMGAAAADGADALVVTSDNPRNEAPEVILDQILDGVPAGTDARRLPDRAAAIAHAVARARPGDAVLVAGKGHETEQVIGSRRLPFSDRDQVRHALEARG